MRTVAAFTDTYRPTVNGVAYTVDAWRTVWRTRGGRMAVVYPEAEAYDPRENEFQVSSAPFPWYSGFRIGRPSIPNGLETPDIVHAHTPFTVGLAGRRLARRAGVPLVVSYHTPAREYASYLSERLDDPIGRVAERYERWFLEEADAIVAPSRTARERVDVDSTPVFVVSNGVDTDRFLPQEEATVERFRRRYDLPESPLVGYTGRHGHEKRIEELLDATAPLDVSVVIGGDGPARSTLERRVGDRSDVTFLGFLERSELPAFYTALDAFAFPSPIETEGLVALEAIACGTPVVAVDAGALSETVVDGRTGYHYPSGDLEAFRAALLRTLEERERLRKSCLERRSSLDVERSIDALESVYESVSTAARTLSR